MMRLLFFVFFVVFFSLLTYFAFQMCSADLVASTC